MFNRHRGALLAAALGLAALSLSTPASAVPCGAYSQVGGIKVKVNGSTVDLGTSSSTCRDGGNNDSAKDLNDGNYFGQSTWQLLDKTDNKGGPDDDLWTFWDGDPTNDVSGKFSITATAWEMYSQLVVVLKGGKLKNSDSKWSAYLLPTDVLGPYEWTYHDDSKDISHISLYGILKERVVSVPEPATLAVFGLGLFGTAVALRKRKAGAEA